MLFGNGRRCMVVRNKKRNFTESDGGYHLFDDSQIILVDLDSGDVVLHYRDYIPYEHGMLYIPLWGGVEEVIDPKEWEVKIMKEEFYEYLSNISQLIQNRNNEEVKECSYYVKYGNGLYKEMNKLFATREECEQFIENKNEE